MWEWESLFINYISSKPFVLKTIKAWRNITTTNMHIIIRFFQMSKTFNHINQMLIKNMHARVNSFHFSCKFQKLTEFLIGLILAWACHGPMDQRPEPWSWRPEVFFKRYNNRTSHLLCIGKKIVTDS